MARLIYSRPGSENHEPTLTLPGRPSGADIPSTGSIRAEPHRTVVDNLQTWKGFSVLYSSRLTEREQVISR